jgi:hypothetical protein
MIFELERPCSLMITDCSVDSIRGWATRYIRTVAIPSEVIIIEMDRILLRVDYRDIAEAQEIPS